MKLRISFLKRGTIFAAAAIAAAACRAEVPHLAGAAVTDMNPGVMLSVTRLEVEGDAPYIFYAAKPGTCYFVGRVNGDATESHMEVKVRFPGFYRLKNPGRRYVLESASVPIALWFGDGQVSYRALDEGAKLWVCPPNWHVELKEVPAEEAEERADMMCAFLCDQRFWHAGPIPVVEAKRSDGPTTVPSRNDIARMEAVVDGNPLHPPKAPRKVAFFNGSFGYAHVGAHGFGPVAFRIASKRTGAFSLDVVTDLSRLSDAEFLSRYDAVVLNSTTSVEESRVPGVGKALTGFVAAGGGLALLHASVDAFYKTPDVQEMNGSLFFGHPWSAPGTWSFINEQSEHPVNAPFRKLPVIMKFSDEIYQFSTPPFDRGSCDVLISMDMSDTLTAAAFDRWRFSPYGKDKQRSDGDFVVSYTKAYGKGRVFYTSFGHDHRAFCDERLAHMLLGLQWTMGDVAVEKKPIAGFADKLWMWGHEPEAWHRFGRAFGRIGMSVSNHCSQAEGCRLMGIKRDCIIRWQSLPKLPVDDAWLKQFAGLDEVAWSITDSDKTLSFLEKVDVAVNMKKRLPNLTTVFLDDYFQSHMRPIDELEKARERVHAAGMKMAAVMYADVEGLRDGDLPSARLCDVIALWFWKPASFDAMEQKVHEARSFLGREMPIWLGLYMWNFGSGFGPVTGPKMKAQLAVADRLLRDGTVEGLIFHPTMSADMDVPAIREAKEWIRSRSSR